MLLDEVALVGEEVLVTAAVQVDANMAAIAAVGATVAAVQNVLLRRLGAVIADQVKIWKGKRWPVRERSAEWTWAERGPRLTFGGVHNGKALDDQLGANVILGAALLLLATSATATAAETGDEERDEDEDGRAADGDQRDVGRKVGIEICKRKPRES